MKLSGAADQRLQLRIERRVPAARDTNQQPRHRRLDRGLALIGAAGSGSTVTL